MNFLKKIFNGIGKDKSNKPMDNKVDIRKKILDCVGPNCIRPSSPEEIISLGEDAVPIAIDILKNFGSAHQWFLTVALREFASQGNEQADQALHDIAAGKITLEPLSYGNVALTKAQEYVLGKKGTPPNEILGEAFELEKEKQFDKALDKYLEYFSLIPTDIEIRIDIGRMYKELGKVDEAINWWEEALAKGLLKPKSDFVKEDIEKAKTTLR